MFYKKSYSKVVLIEMFILLIFIIVLYVIDNTQYMVYEKTVNEKISEIASIVKEKYPNISDTELIETIKSGNQIDENFLKQYGYTTDTQYINEVENNRNKTITINLLLIFCMGFLEIGIFLYYHIKQSKQINEINLYFKALNNNKNYKLRLEDNNEDELSKLRNEIYKTSILLQETAEISKKESMELSDSIADISHQLKTPLTSMRIMVDNILDNPNMNDETRNEFIETISRQVDWMSSLVISLLKLARFDAGMIKMDDQEINVKTLITNIINNLSIMIEVKSIKINVKVDDDIYFNADYKWQLEAITNIIKNAIEHSKKNSNIYIKTISSSIFLKIIIKDEGEGISQEDIKHIFERFYKSKNSSENSIGIGLALAKSIIEKDNGYITVSSDEGKGTTFEIRYLR